MKQVPVVTSYTRWLKALIVKGTENQEVCVTFSPQFERIWLESKRRLPEYVSENRPVSYSGANIRFAFMIGQKAPRGQNRDRFGGGTPQGARPGVDKDADGNVIRVRYRSGSAVFRYRTTAPVVRCRCPS
jgi:hypothetical protein